MATTKFITRVELYGAHHSGAEYAQLHAAMAQLKFHRVINATNEAATYHLPPAEYYCFGELDADAVARLAAAAAKAIGYVPWPGTVGSTKHCAIVVSEWTKIRWMGLKKAA